MVEIIRQPEKSPARLSGFCGHTLHAPISSDQVLTRVIHRTVSAARDAGLDHGGQTRQAIQAVRQIRPDVQADEALSLVQHVRD